MLFVSLFGIQYMYPFSLISDKQATKIWFNPSTRPFASDFLSQLPICSVLWYLATWTCWHKFEGFWKLLNFLNNIFHYRLKKKKKKHQYRPSPSFLFGQCNICFISLEKITTQSEGNQKKTGFHNIKKASENISNCIPSKQYDSMFGDYALALEVCSFRHSPEKLEIPAET